MQKEYISERSDRMIGTCCKNYKIVLLRDLPVEKVDELSGVLGDKKNGERLFQLCAWKGSDSGK